MRNGTSNGMTVFAQGIIEAAFPAAQPGCTARGRFEQIDRATRPWTGDNAALWRGKLAGDVLESTLFEFAAGKAVPAALGQRVAAVMDGLKYVRIPRELTPIVRDEVGR